jgi:thioredoxin reductase
VAVVGRGQSACESAVLLGEAGAQAEVVCRGPIHWIGSETPGKESGLRWRLHQLLTPKFVIGPFPLNWFATFPGLLRHAPHGLRGRIATRCLRPAATAWLRPRAGAVRVHTGCSVVAAEAKGTGVSLQLSDGHAVFADHVLLATGYRVDIARYEILSPELAERVQRAGGYPVLNAGFESSVPGLHFIGACAAGSFGPMLRFVVGTGYAARSLTDAVASRR